MGAIFMKLGRAPTTLRSLIIGRPPKRSPRQRRTSAEAQVRSASRSWHLEYRTENVSLFTQCGYAICLGNMARPTLLRQQCRVISEFRPEHSEALRFPKHWPETCTEFKVRLPTRPSCKRLVM